VSNVLAGAFGTASAKAAPLVDELLGPLVICTANGATVVGHEAFPSRAISTAYRRSQIGAS